MKKHYHVLQWLTSAVGAGDPEDLGLVTFNLRVQQLDARLTGMYIGRPTYGLAEEPYNWVLVTITGVMNSGLYSFTGGVPFPLTGQNVFQQFFGIGGLNTGGVGVSPGGSIYANGMSVPLNLQFTVQARVFQANIAPADVMNLTLTLEIESAQ